MSTEETTAPATLSTPAAAAHAGVSERTIRNWIGRKHIAYVRDEDGQRRVVVASLDAYLRERGTVPAAPAAPDPAVTEALATLPTLVAELASTRRELSDAQWRVGYLTAQLEAERQRVRQLEAGPVAAAEPEAPAAEAASVPDDVPETVPERVPWWRRIFSRDAV